MSNVSLKEWLELERRELLLAVKSAIRDHVTTLRSAHSDIYGFALLPGDSYEVKTLVVAWNRTRDLKQDKAYYRYAVDEWLHWDHDALAGITPLIEGLNEQFSKLHQKSTDDFIMDDFELAHIQSYFDTFLRALHELKDEGVFAFRNVEPYLLIWISDSGHEIIHRSVEELNSVQTVREFKSEFT